MIDRVLLVGPSTALDLQLLRGNEKNNTRRVPRKPLRRYAPRGLRPASLGSLGSSTGVG